MIDIRVLTLLQNILSPKDDSRPTLYIKEIITRQLAVTDDDSRSWTRRAATTLSKYDLPSAYKLLDNPPRKLAWKKRVQQAVHAEWTDRLQEDADMKSTLQYLNIKACAVGYLHPVWQDINNDLDLKKATIKAQLLVKRYPLASTKLAGELRSSTCPLCKEEEETTSHFLLQCPALREARRPYLMRILCTCRQLGLSVDPDTLTKTVLDTTNLPTDDLAHERLCRNMVFKLHHKRGILLGGGSVYIRWRGNQTKTK